MEVTRTAHYTIRVLVELAKEKDRMVPSKEISEKQKVPLNYIPKIALILSTKGLVRTEKGKMGGMKLTVDPSQITLFDVLVAVEGPLYFNRCRLVPSECPHGEDDPIGSVWDEIQQKFTEILKGITITDLVKRVNKFQGVIT